MHRNSVIITKKNKSKLSIKLGISIPTLNKYIQSAIDNKWIIPYKGNLKVIRLKDLLKDFRLKTGLKVFQHGIISAGKTTDFQSIQNEIIDILIVDNVVRPQKYRINRKKLILRRSKTILSTDNSIQLSREKRNTKDNIKFSKIMASIAKKVGIPAKMCDDMVKVCKQLVFNRGNQLDVVSSARHTASIVGLSKTRSNKALRTSKKFKSHIHDQYIDLIHPEQYEAVKLEFPNACVIPMPFINKIAIRFGSIIEMNDRSHIFDFKDKSLELA